MVAKLLIVKSSILFNLVYSRGPIDGNMNIWYGGIRVNDIFTWSDKTPFTTTFWYPGEPNGLLRGEKCLHMTDGAVGQWNDLDCSRELRYVCKLEKGKRKVNRAFGSISLGS